MLFRPEEMDATSRVGPIFGPFSQGYVDITLDCGRGLAFYDPVTHGYPHGLTAIQAGRIDLNSFTREDPADRQGFKTSLCEPSLPAVNSNQVLRGQVVEGCK